MGDKISVLYSFFPLYLFSVILSHSCLSLSFLSFPISLHPLKVGWCCMLSPPTVLIQAEPTAEEIQEAMSPLLSRDNYYFLKDIYPWGSESQML